MAIREQIIVDIAIVDVGDDYQVELWQEKKLTSYSVQQARDLALELIQAAESAEAAIAEDMEARGLRLTEAEIRTATGEVVL